MANSGNPPIINNASRFPRDMARAIKARPTLLRDETPEVLNEVARALARAGFGAELLDACAEAGLDNARRAAIRAACRNHGVLH